MSQPERRELEFNSFDAIIADVEQLASGEVKTSGKHSFAEIVRHLALTNDMASGRIQAPQPPLMMRLILPFIRSSILNGPIKPGIKLPKKSEAFFWPDAEVSLSDAVAHLKESVEHYTAKGPLPVHPVFGKATRDQIDGVTLRHAAMHLSFAHPA